MIALRVEQPLMYLIFLFLFQQDSRNFSKLVCVYEMSFWTFSGGANWSRIALCNRSPIHWSVSLLFTMILWFLISHRFLFTPFTFVTVIVIPIWKEPLPGWTDNINGPTGLLIGAGKGVIRTMFCNNQGYADYLPVDITVNGIILLTWNYIGNK